ncbi:MAG: hypothetical protein ABSD03_12380 [Vulcanimicrobiaceae bacterium]
MAQPYLALYTRDWRSDPRLRASSLAARGLWADLLSLMHEATPYGYLVVADRRCGLRDAAFIAAQVVAPKAAVVRALKELVAKNVCSVDDDGTIFSRRMVRDEKKRSTYAANGRAGARATSERYFAAANAAANGHGNPEQEQPRPNAGARSRPSQARPESSPTANSGRSRIRPAPPDVAPVAFDDPADEALVAEFLVLVAAHGDGKIAESRVQRIRRVLHDALTEYGRDAWRHAGDITIEANPNGKRPENYWVTVAKNRAAQVPLIPAGAPRDRARAGAGAPSNIGPVDWEKLE